MFLRRDKVIDKPAFSIAISHDGKRMAINGETKVYVYELATWEMVVEIKVRHASCIYFLEDNHSLFILNTRGDIYLWKANGLKRQLTIPNSDDIRGECLYVSQKCILIPIFYGVLKYDAENNELTKIFTTDKRIVDICGLLDEEIKLFVGEMKLDYQKFDIIKIEPNGRIIKQVETELIPSRAYSKPTCVNDEIIVFTTREIRRKGHNIGWLYFLDDQGKYIRREPYEESHYCTCQKEWIVLYPFGGHSGVRIYDVNSFKLLWEVDRGFFEEKKNPNPISVVKFINDERVMIGTWEALYVFLIEE